jgi:hypothetical protein
MSAGTARWITVGRGESVSVEAGSRDQVFFRSGWPPETGGNVTVRTSRESRAVVHFPLPARGDYDVVLRVDPVDADTARALILFNQQFVAQFNLEKTAGRVGSYRVTLPRQWQWPGDNAVAVAPSTPAGVRLWFVRIIPTSPPSNAH